MPSPTPLDYPNKPKSPNATPKSLLITYEILDNRLPFHVNAAYERPLPKSQTGHSESSVINRPAEKRIPDPLNQGASIRFRLYLFPLIQLHIGTSQLSYEVSTTNEWPLLSRTRSGAGIKSLPNKGSRNLGRESNELASGVIGSRSVAAAW